MSYLDNFVSQIGGNYSQYGGDSPVELIIVIVVIILLLICCCSSSSILAYYGYKKYYPTTTTEAFSSSSVEEEVNKCREEGKNFSISTPFGHFCI